MGVFALLEKKPSLCDNLLKPIIKNVLKAIFEIGSGI